MGRRAGSVAVQDLAGPRLRALSAAWPMSSDRGPLPALLIVLAAVLALVAPATSDGRSGRYSGGRCGGRAGRGPDHHEDRLPAGDRNRNRNRHRSGRRGADELPCRGRAPTPSPSTVGPRPRATQPTSSATTASTTSRVLQLRGAGGLPTAPIGDSGQVVVGEPTVGLGNARRGVGAPLTHETGPGFRLSTGP